MENRHNKNTSAFSAFTINIIFILFVIIGLSLLRYVPVKLNPDKTLPVIYINFNYYGATSEIVEKQVTSQIESVMQLVKGVEHIASTSGNGWGQVEVSISESANAEMLRFEILTLIREIYPKLPNEVTYPIVSQQGADDENKVQLMTYTINGNTDSYTLYKYLDNNVEPQLATIKDVHKIEVHGSTPYHWEIVYNTNRLKQLGIDKNDIRKAIYDFYLQTDLGLKKYASLTGSDTLFIMTTLKGAKKDPETMPDIPVKKINGQIIYLKDIAQIAHKQKKQQSFYRINGLTAVNMVIYSTSEANQIQLAQSIREKMSGLEEALPPGYSFTLAYDASVFLETEIHKTFWRTLASILVLFVFVLVISRNFRYLAIIAISLLANLCIAIFFYYILKVEIHLYSLAGITVSLGILIDNSIIMADHIRHKKDRKVFLAILAATLTTIGALTVIFFLPKEQQINLIDFAWVVIINLSVSLGIALFFIPSLMEKIPLNKKTGKWFIRRKRRVVIFNRWYQNFIRFAVKYRAVVIIIGVLAFGLPVFLLPNEIKGEQWYVSWYNKTLGHEKYSENIKPVMDKILGGTLRLFSEYVREDNYFASPERTTLNVRVKLPQGATIDHLNEIYLDFENFLGKFEEIDFYQTNIYSLSNSQLTIYFKKDFDNSAFPYLLKSRLESKAIDISSADFSIYGVGRGFSNALYSGFKNSRLIFTGYNYDELLEYTRIAKEKLIKNPRINEIFIESGKSWWFVNTKKRYLSIDKEALAHAQTPLNNLVHKIGSFNRQSEYLFDIPFYDEFEEVRILSARAKSSDLWALMEYPFDAEKTMKLKDIAYIEEENASESIYRENQEYILTLAYDFIGPDELSRIVLKDYEQEINQLLPVGYKAYIPSYGQWWNVKEKKQYLLLFLMILIVYVICTVLLESFIQPAVVIAMIPLSFIGIFLTFYWFEFKFDQGGYAAFLLVSGLVVNSALYIINDLNNLDKHKPGVIRLRRYIKAYSSKIIPVFLTIMSTILGLVPFIFWGNKEPFWFALAVGTIGGLIFSVPAIVIFLPLMLKGIIHKKKR
ncbi:MAG: efflux RND transporter permease subunit [Bacteroidota bacterium]|nr:efflux RND transporter permease subunit [Bacteroidota bacterium]